MTYQRNYQGLGNEDLGYLSITLPVKPTEKEAASLEIAVDALLQIINPIMDRASDIEFYSHWLEFERETLRVGLCLTYRHIAKEEGDYELADHIRSSAEAIDWVIEDQKDGTVLFYPSNFSKIKWKHTFDTIELRGSVVQEDRYLPIRAGKQ